MWPVQPSQGYRKGSDGNSVGNSEKVIDLWFNFLSNILDDDDQNRGLGKTLQRVSGVAKEEDDFIVANLLERVFKEKKTVHLIVEQSSQATI